MDRRHRVFQLSNEPSRHRLDGPPLCSSIEDQSDQKNPRSVPPDIVQRNIVAG